MAQTQTADSTKKVDQTRSSTSQGQVVAFNARLAYPLDCEGKFDTDTFKLTEQSWRVLIDAIFPSAKTIEAVKMALAYCHARKLDILKKPVHIVPIRSSVLNKWVESIWPSINEIRTTAARTKEYAGCEEAVFGDIVDIDEEREIEAEDERGDKRKIKIKVKYSYPSWCRITVYRFVQGQRCAFPGPRIMWKEAYARVNRNSDAPNDMWMKRPSGQLEKCAEAAALRKAFPEEVGNEMSAEEMEGQIMDTTGMQVAAIETPERPRAPSAQAPTAIDVEVEAETSETAEIATSDDEPASGFDPVLFMGGYLSTLAKCMTQEAVTELVQFNAEEVGHLSGEQQADLANATTARRAEIEPKGPSRFVPVPANATGGAAWGDWEKAIRAVIAEAKTIRDVAAIKADNSETFALLDTKGAKARKLVDNVAMVMLARQEAITAAAEEPQPPQNAQDDFGPDGSAEDSFDEGTPPAASQAPATAPAATPAPKAAAKAPAPTSTPAPGSVTPPSPEAKKWKAEADALITFFKAATTKADLEARTKMPRAKNLSEMTEKAPAEAQRVLTVVTELEGRLQ